MQCGKGSNQASNLIVPFINDNVIGRYSVAVYPLDFDVLLNSGFFPYQPDRNHSKQAFACQFWVIRETPHDVFTSKTHIRQTIRFSELGDRLGKTRVVRIDKIKYCIEIKHESLKLGYLTNNISKRGWAVFQKQGGGLNDARVFVSNHVCTPSLPFLKEAKTIDDGSFHVEQGFQR
jgi:hypothetical protein